MKQKIINFWNKKNTKKLLFIMGIVPLALASISSAILIKNLNNLSTQKSESEFSKAQKSTNLKKVSKSLLSEDLNEIQKPVNNSKFVANKVFSKELFGYNTEGSNSYRIPGVIQTKNGQILVNADKRVENIEDYNNTIDQVFKVSKDNGNTWSQNKLIVKVATPKTNKGLVIDGTFVNAEYSENNQSKEKLIFLFNIFAERAGVPHLMRGNPWLQVENEKMLKLWIKTNGKFDKNNSVLRKVVNKENWYRRYVIKNGLKYNQISSLSQLIPTNTYVDNTYNSETKMITGTVYENVQENELNNSLALASKKTNHSIWDSYSNSTKYYLSKNNHNATLESYDGGNSWTNFKMIDEDISFNPYRDESFSGNAVGSGIQLKRQKNSQLNGRVIFGMYNYTAGRQSAYYIYSDDLGKTWKKFIPQGFKTNLTESTFVEMENGDLYWFMRHSVWGSENNKPSIAKSNDGGLTWFSPSDLNAKYKDINLKVDGNLFSGISTFKLNDKNYFAFALPKENFRRAGSLYITDENFNEFTEVYTFDKNNQEHFAYSYTLTLNSNNKQAELLVVYEWSPKTKIFNEDKFNNNRPKGGGIQLEKITIQLK